MLVKKRKDCRSIGRDAHVALRECAVYLVLHEGKTQAEAAQAVGVYRKRDRKIIHSLCLIFTTFVLISLSVHGPCAGRACLFVNEGISCLTYRRGCAVLAHSFDLRASECASAHS